ncbi:hypothetical protein KEM52_005707 [Ascosphaera acerosa]|nr:hypothetical protein KEM52_005707 [Ascosphaera acerosa]
MSPEESYLESLKRDGFVVICGLLDEDRVASLKTIAIAATTRARQGKWPYFRTVPKQFPPWPENCPPPEEGGIWGVQHLLHPDMEGREDFAALYFSPEMLSVAGHLLGVQDMPSDSAQEPLVMELFNLLIAPEQRDFELRWHRDDIADTVTAEEEAAQLAQKSPEGRQSHAQYNLALCRDDSLIVVPGSHRRARTETERNADPFAASLPGQLVVTLEPGDAVFYDSNILHRGVYQHKPPDGSESRLTLHGSVGLRSDGQGGTAGDARGKVRARAVLQHGIGFWVADERAGFERCGKVSARATAMRANLIAMGTGEGVGYSLEG